MKPRIPMSVVVGVLGGLACLVTMPGLGLPVWALFIGWAWYYAFGATTAVFKMVPSVIAGAVCASLAVWLLGWAAGLGFSGMPALVLIVGLTVFLLMLLIKIPIFSTGPIAFNGYSTVFALTFIGGFPDLAVGPIISCFLWAVIANLLGPVFGWLSIVLQFPRKVEETAEKNG